MSDIKSLIYCYLWASVLRGSEGLETLLGKLVTSAEYPFPIPAVCLPVANWDKSIISHQETPLALV